MTATAGVPLKRQWELVDALLAAARDGDIEALVRVLDPGAFFIVPSHTIHRETTGLEEDLEAFLIGVGGEPEHVDVDRPEPAGG